MQNNIIDLRFNFLCYITISLTVDTSLWYMKILFQTQLYNNDNVFAWRLGMKNVVLLILLTTV